MSSLSDVGMVEDKYDRGFDPDTIAWAVFSPQMLEEFHLATHAQAAEYFGVDVATLEAAKPGDWMTYKHGIAFRLGRFIDSDTGPR